MRGACGAALTARRSRRSRSAAPGAAPTPGSLLAAWLAAKRLVGARSRRHDGATLGWAVVSTRVVAADRFGKVPGLPAWLCTREWPRDVCSDVRAGTPQADRPTGSVG